MNTRNLLIVFAAVIVASIAYDTVIGPALAGLMAAPDKSKTGTGS